MTLAEATLEAVLAAVPDVVYVLDRELRVVRMNEAAAAGWKRTFGIERHIGDRYDDGLPAEAGGDRVELMRRALAGESLRVERRLVEGQFRRLSLTPVRVGEDVVGVVVVSQVMARV